MLSALSSGVHTVRARTGFLFAGMLRTVSIRAQLAQRVRVLRRRIQTERARAAVLFAALCGTIQFCALTYARQVESMTLKQWFEQHVMRVEDMRVRRIARKVWQRLPQFEQATLRNVLIDFENNADTRGVGIVPLARASAAQSDAATRYAIALELAHQVLRHAQFRSLLNARVASSVVSDANKPRTEQSLLDIWIAQRTAEKRAYAPEDYAALTRWETDTATALCDAWGFGDDLRAYLDEFPDALRPRWLDETKENNDEHIADSQTTR